MSEARTIEEAYESATSTSNLKVVAERRGDGDILIAAGWSNEYLGLALLRLHSEWESASKPKIPDPYLIAKMGKQFDDEALRGDPKATLNGMERAKKLAHTWYANELLMLRLRLKELPSVSRQLYLRAERKGLPREIIAPVMAWWLSQACVPCGGHGKTMIPGTPTLSAHKCPACRGSTKKTLPGGQQERWLANVMEASLNSARMSLKRPFVHQSPKPLQT